MRNGVSPKPGARQLHIPSSKFPARPGILIPKGGSPMKLTTVAITAGISAAAGAVAVMMMPHQNPVRKLASKAANKAEDLAWKLEDKMNGMDF